jgi:hypothetical protein
MSTVGTATVPLPGLFHSRPFLWLRMQPFSRYEFRDQIQQTLTRRFRQILLVTLTVPFLLQIVSPMN